MSDLLLDLIELVVEVVGDLVVSSSSKKTYRENPYNTGNPNHWSNSYKKSSSSSYQRPYYAKAPKPMYSQTTKTTESDGDKDVKSESLYKTLHTDMTIKPKQEEKPIEVVEEKVVEAVTEPEAVISEPAKPVHNEPEKDYHAGTLDDDHLDMEKVSSFEDVSVSEFKIDMPSYDSKLEDVKPLKEVEVDDPFESASEDPVAQIKLELLLLAYMFQEDDGKISGKEKRWLKKHFTKFKGQLSQYDIEHIKEYDRLDKSLTNISAFISTNGVTNRQISNAITMLKDVDNELDRYRSIITRIESSLLSSMGF